MNSKRGFSFVEMMVVAFIVGILASLSFPIYSQHMKRVTASEAVAGMTAVRQAMRDYFINHNAYFDVQPAKLTEIPTEGLDLKFGVVQYFSSQAYSVDATSPSSPRFTAPPVVDFLITVDGSLSVACGSSAGECAIKNQGVSLFRLEMDNSGRTFVSYNAGTSWQAY